MPGPTARPGSSQSFDEAWHMQGRKAPHTGARWGDFELGGILGEGGMGAVYRAQQVSLKRRVALKVLPPALARDQQLLARFHLEATTASKLQSPHIVQVYAIGEHDGNHWFAMEFVEGQDLHDVAAERRKAGSPLTLDEAAGFILQAAKGLADAGRLGVVHRDIKPANLMIARDGLLKIADFGLVKVLGEQQLTLTGQAMGTPSYVSPEQGSGESTVDARSDLYSLGVVFYELACGRRPFTAATPGALIYQHCFEEPPLPTELVPGFPAQWQAVILKCLQKKPENRYQDAAGLIRDIEAIRHGQLIANVLAGTGADEAKREKLSWIQRNLLPVAIAAALAVAAAGAGGWWWTQRDKGAQIKAQVAAETRVGPLRAALAQVLDPVQAPPDDASGRVDELARLAPQGAQDADVQRWRGKLAAVAAADGRIAELVAAPAAPAVRGELARESEALAALVGSDQRSVRAGRARMAALDAEVARLRGLCAQGDSAQLRLEGRNRLHGAAAALAILAGDDDAAVVAAGRRVAAYDAALAGARARMAPLDAAKTITEEQRAQFASALADITVLLDAADDDVRRWSQTLAKASSRVDALRGRITTVVGRAPEVIPEVQQQQVAGDLAAYRALTGDADPFAKDWLAAIALTTATIDGCTGRLAGWAGRAVDGVLPVAVHEPFARDLARLNQLRLPDERMRAWDALLSTSQRTTRELDAAIVPLAAAATLTVANQAQLRQAVDRLAAVGGLDPAAAEAHRTRLTAETARVAGLRSGLAGLDQAQPITRRQRDDLAQLARDAGADDRDVKRWQAKVARSDEIAHRLGALDRREPPPSDLDRLFAAYQAEVGPQDPQLLGWRSTVERITAARAVLAVLDRRTAFAQTEIDAALENLAALVATSEPGLLRWRAKADEVRLHHRELAALARRPALGAAEDAAARQRLARLARDLTGSDDPAVVAGLRRLAELAGPPRPAWAADHGRDSRGSWADAALPGANLRFRWIAPGTVTVGSPDDEPGREADELRVALTLSAGCWLAESELPRAVWVAVMGADPSRGPAGDPLQMPVDRVSWDDAQELCRRLAVTLPIRLPLEAEWEWACRAGSDAPWCWPAGEPPGAPTIDKLAWTAANSGDFPHAVRERLPNAAGLYDLHGNLAEWCADAYGPYPTAASIVSGPAAGGVKRVARGGSWADAREKTRAANRMAVDPGLRSPYVGLRLALDAAGWQAGGQAGEIDLRIGGLRLRLGREGDGP